MKIDNVHGLSTVQMADDDDVLSVFFLFAYHREEDYVSRLMKSWVS